MPTYRDHICLIRNACFPIVFENISLRIRNIQSILYNLNMYIETKCLKNENIVKLCVVLGNTSTFLVRVRVQEELNSQYAHSFLPTTEKPKR